MDMREEAVSFKKEVGGRGARGGLRRGEGEGGGSALGVDRESLSSREPYTTHLVCHAHLRMKKKGCWEC